MALSTFFIGFLLYLKHLSNTQLEDFELLKATVIPSKNYELRLVNFSNKIKKIKYILSEVDQITSRI